MVRNNDISSCISYRSLQLCHKKSLTKYLTAGYWQVLIESIYSSMKSAFLSSACGKRSLGRQQVFCDTWNRGLSCVKTWSSPQKQAWKRSFKLPWPLFFLFSTWMCENWNHDIWDVLGCLDLKIILSKRTTMVKPSTIVSNANHL